MLLAGKIVQKTASVATSAWNPSDKGSYINLSNGYKTAATTGAGQVRGVSGKTTGKYYFEVTATVVGVTGVGVSDATGVLSVTPGGIGSAALLSRGNVYFGGNNTVECVGFSTGSVVGVAVDAGNRTIDFYVNGAFRGSASSASCPTGTLFPAFGASATGASGVLNTGGSDFSYTPPSGYSAWG